MVSWQDGGTGKDVDLYTSPSTLQALLRRSCTQSEDEEEENLLQGGSSDQLTWAAGLKSMSYKLAVCGEVEPGSGPGRRSLGFLPPSLITNPFIRYAKTGL
jgi:hypothetical protein